MKKRLLPVLALLLTAMPLAAQNKTALVIGNSSYRNYPALRQSAGEALELSAALERLGFEVQVILDAAEDEMRLALLDFEAALKRRAGIALFHYGGRGVQVDGRNYLLASDSKIRDERLVRYNALSVDEVLDRMEASGSDAGIVILDACRESPLPAGRSTPRGLAAPTRLPPNSVVVYAAEAGEAAEEGHFVPALLNHVETQGISVTDILINTKAAVDKASKGRRGPGIYGALPERIYLAGPTSAGGSAEAPETDPAPSVPPARVGDRFIFVRGGTFRMGNPDTAVDQSDSERPVHAVTLDGFWMSPYEVTQNEYKEIMGRNPSFFKGGSRPVETVSWYEALEFCNALSRREGLQEVYSGSGLRIKADFSKNGYRLPTEAEWEYAARGARISEGYRYSGSGNPDAVAWYSDNSGTETHPVGSKASNELGLYDMSGNVWEWCWDRYFDDYYRNGPKTNPRGPERGDARVIRGGGSYHGAHYSRATCRLALDPEDGNDVVGFRICRNAY